MSDPTASRPVPRLGERFLVVNTLGDGGTATVYLAYDQRTGAWNALKALHRKYLDDEEIKHRFGFEARALELLEHPNVPKLVHYAPESRPPFMVMELARCGSVMDWVRKHGSMPARTACDVILQVCDAVAAAHGAGMIHRDIKPHNLLLDDTGVCKLTDFGIARLGDSPSLTATGSQIGTFSFMAPEQRSDTKAVDLRADIYSLGASFYTMLTGRTSAELFVAESDDSLMASVPEPLRDIILRATKYQPDERYASAEELREVIRGRLHELEPPSRGAPPLVPELAPLPRRAPRRIPASRSFPELEGLVPGLMGDEEAPPAQEELASGSSWSALPYTMPERRLPRRSRVETSGPVMLAPVRNSTPQELSRVPAPRRIPAPSTLSAPESEPRPPAMVQLTVVLLGLVGLVALFVTGVLAAGAWSVTSAQHSTLVRERHLLTTVQTEASLLSRMRGDPAAVSEALQQFRAADRESQVQAAIAFVEVVEAAQDQGRLERAARPQVDRLRSAREAYLEARQEWSGSVSEFPGRIAHGWGVVTGPR